MSVSIRLAKFGKKHAPSYRVVVTQTRTKRNGAFIDIIGHYNPSDSTKEFTLDKKIYEDWVSKGAIVSDAVKKLVEGTYEYKKYEPKKAKPGREKPAGEGAVEGAVKGTAETVAEETPQVEEKAEEPVKDVEVAEETAPAEEKSQE